MSRVRIAQSLGSLASAVFVLHALVVHYISLNIVCLSDMLPNESCTVLFSTAQFTISRLLTMHVITMFLFSIMFKCIVLPN